MGNILTRNRSSSTGKVKVTVKDLKTGKQIIIDVQKPFEYTVDQLLGQISSRLRADKGQISLKYKKRDITKGSDNLSATSLGDALSLDKSGEANTTVNLFFERVERRGELSTDWVIYIKNLTGKVFDINFYDPQEVSVIGLKLLIEEEYSGDFKPDQMRLDLNNQQLEDNTQLVQNIPGVSNECTIHLVMI